MKNWLYRLILTIMAFLLVACGDPGNTPQATSTQNGQVKDNVIDEPTTSPTHTPLPSGTTKGAELTTAAPETTITSPAPSSPGEPEEVVVMAGDGLEIRGTFYRGSGQGPWPGLLLLHMNGRIRQDWGDVAQQLAEHGYGSLAIDMRGHGETGGTADWQQAQDDLQSVWTYLASRDDVDSSRTAVVGASIGANMSLVTAIDQPTIRTAVLLSPGLNYLGVSTDDRIIAYGERPLLIVASEEDTYAADSSRTLADLAKGDTRLELYKDAGHGTRMFDTRPELSALIIEWLDTHVKGQPPAGSDPGRTGGGDLLAPTFLDIAWDDRAPFRQGVIEAEAAAVDRLPGASVYHMDLVITPDLLNVSGQQEVRYTNQETVSLDEIYYHLFPNLLGGSVLVSDLIVNGQPVEPAYELQRSVLHVPLMAPLEPGEQVVIAMTFQVEVPTEGGSNYGVFASIDGVLALAHFYPQIAVYDDEGWNIDFPSPNADVTYADSAYYLVRVNAPARQVIISSGSAIERLADGDGQTILLAAGPVRDFYLVSSDDFQVSSRTVGDTVVNSYGFPLFNAQREQTLDYAAAALIAFNERFGPYPFTEFDVAPTPNLALGVEYPGVVVINASLYDPGAFIGQTPATQLLESTVAHEVAHQWFYSLVGNDQLDEPWVDESLTQYVTYLYYLDSYGRTGADGFRQSWQSRWDRVGREDVPIGQPAGAYSPLEYSAIVYGRGPLFFEALAGEMGQETFDTFLRDYVQANKWGIATGEGLKALAEEACGCDLTPLFAEWVGQQ